MAIRFAIDNNVELCFYYNTSSNKWEVLDTGTNVISSLPTTSDNIERIKGVLNAKLGNLGIYKIIKPDLFGNKIDLNNPADMTGAKKYGNITEYNQNI